MYIYKYINKYIKKSTQRKAFTTL
uniref:Uncharacterized protein n=1 Tax=Anguilla anguilla TaxID=7936 RepID=A0A0E9UB66_ANGAN